MALTENEGQYQLERRMSLRGHHQLGLGSKPGLGAEALLRCT